MNTWKTVELLNITETIPEEKRYDEIEITEFIVESIYEFIEKHFDTEYKETPYNKIPKMPFYTENNKKFNGHLLHEYQPENDYSKRIVHVIVTGKDINSFPESENIISSEIELVLYQEKE